MERWPPSYRRATLLDAFESNLSDGRNLQSTRDAMWHQLGDATAQVMIAGAATLAMIWDAAWAQGRVGSAALLVVALPVMRICGPATSTTTF